jgi:uncharacterized membrane protein YkvA (DUF1232 family)
MSKLTPPNMNLFTRIVKDIRLLFMLIGDFTKGRYRDISPLSFVVFVIAALYVLLPIDLVNDFIPGLGQLDDMAFFLACLYFLEKDLYRYQDWKSDNQTG